MVSVTTQLKLLASVGKRYLTDILDYTGIIALGKEFQGKKAKQLEVYSEKMKRETTKSKTTICRHTIYGTMVK